LSTSKGILREVRTIRTIKPKMCNNKNFLQKKNNIWTQKNKWKKREEKKARKVASILTMVEHVIQRTLEKCYQIDFTIWHGFLHIWGVWEWIAPQHSNWIKCSTIRISQIYHGTTSPDNCFSKQRLRIDMTIIGHIPTKLAKLHSVKGKKGKKEK
jgi:hypothetical protein